MAIDKGETDTNRAATNTDPEEKPSKSDLNDSSSTPRPEKIDEEPEWIDLLGSESLLKKITKVGQPDTRPQRLQKCTINYELTLSDGTFVERKENQEIQLGDCEVVQGLDVALGLMNVKERCVLKIEPRLAFGTIGLSPKIPPNSVVIYDIELVAVEPEDDPEALPISERKIQGYVKNGMIISVLLKNLLKQEQEARTRQLVVRPRREHLGHPVLQKSVGLLGRSRGRDRLHGVRRRRRRSDRFHPAKPPGRPHQRVQQHGGGPNQAGTVRRRSQLAADGAAVPAQQRQSALPQS
jgi:FKBP-type peptidyl-prolyl cis-trans isomerase